MIEYATGKTKKVLKGWRKKKLQMQVTYKTFEAKKKNFWEPKIWMFLP